MMNTNSDNHGYVKMVDFGFSKRMEVSEVLFGCRVRMHFGNYTTIVEEYKSAHSLNCVNQFDDKT